MLKAGDVRLVWLEETIELASLSVGFFAPSLLSSRALFPRWLRTTERKEGAGCRKLAPMTVARRTRKTQTRSAVAFLQRFRPAIGPPLFVRALGSVFSPRPIMTNKPDQTSLLYDAICLCSQSRWNEWWPASVASAQHSMSTGCFEWGLL
jgi:hypothetical protein